MRRQGWVSAGVFGGFFSESNTEFYLVNELQAMGVLQKDVRVTKRNDGAVHLFFRLPWEKKKREIVFVHTRLPVLDKAWMNTMKNKLHGLDGYFQKASQRLEDENGVYLHEFTQMLIKPGGFLMLNDTDSFGSHVDFSHMLRKTFSRRMNPAMKKWDEENKLYDPWFGYGKQVSVWQKLFPAVSVNGIENAVYRSL